MNKNLKEAINYLKGGNMFGELSNEALEEIEKLVDKAKPMKPTTVMFFGEEVPTCPAEKCGVGLNPNESVWHKSSCCGNCGQKIDWT